MVVSNATSSAPKSLRDLAATIAYHPQIDTDLKRYSPALFKSHIKDSCGTGHYIEAYTLALQYVEDLFYYFVQDNGKLMQTDVPKVLCILSGLNLINAELYALFTQVNVARNILAHKIIRTEHESTRRNFGKTTPAEHEQKLMSLIEMAEKEYVSLVKKFPHRFRPAGNAGPNYKRVLILSSIILDQVWDENPIPKSLAGKTEEAKLFIKKAFIKRFKEVLLHAYPEEKK